MFVLTANITQLENSQSFFYFAGDRQYEGNNRTDTLPAISS